MEQDVREYAERLRHLRTKREERTDAGNTFGNSNMRHDGTVPAASPPRNNREILRRY